jgi:hypothetical protein
MFAHRVAIYFTIYVTQWLSAVYTSTHPVWNLSIPHPTLCLDHILSTSHILFGPYPFHIPFGTYPFQIPHLVWNLSIPHPQISFGTYPFHIPTSRLEPIHSTSHILFESYPLYIPHPATFGSSGQHSTHYTTKATMTDFYL